MPKSTFKKVGSFIRDSATEMTGGLLGAFIMLFATKTFGLQLFDLSSLETPQVISFLQDGFSFVFWYVVATLIVHYLLYLKKPKVLKKL